MSSPLLSPIHLNHTISLTTLLDVQDAGKNPTQLLLLTTTPQVI